LASEGELCSTNHSKDDMMDENYKILIGKPEWTSPLGGWGHRLQDDIKVGLKEMVSEDVGWLHLTQDRYQ
jgi:hypothetical protein